MNYVLEIQRENIKERKLSMSCQSTQIAFRYACSCSKDFYPLFKPKRSWNCIDCQQASQSSNLKQLWDNVIF